MDRSVVTKQMFVQLNTIIYIFIFEEIIFTDRTGVGHHHEPQWHTDSPRTEQ